MTTQKQLFQFKNSYSKLPQEFFFEVSSTSFKNPKLLYLNQELFEWLGGDFKSYSDKDLANFFSGSKKFHPDPYIAVAYAGHQFGQFVPRLGDGRAMLAGEIQTPQGQVVDMVFKGSGPTPFSRRGDGLLALGPALRESIVSEAMNNFKVPTSRTLALTLTNQPVYREDIFKGAVLTRIAESHIRVGTFEYFLAQNNIEGIRLLANYVIDRHYPHLKETKGSLLYFEFFKEVIKKQMELIAKWMSLGFIHGVMNTDNMLISGETIDYGPCAFLDEFNYHKVFSSIDHSGRYAYSQQPSIAKWNLSSFANAIFYLMGGDKGEKIKKLTDELDNALNIFNQSWHQIMLNKMGLPKSTDKKVIDLFLNYLHQEELDFTLSFRNLTSLLYHRDHDFYPKSDSFYEFLSLWEQQIELTLKEKSKDDLILEMNQVNPFIIPRNHQIEAAIQMANKNNDYSLFHKLNKALSSPYEEIEEFHFLSIPPKKEERVTQTFCGT